MSRIGKNPVTVPAGVDVKIDGGLVRAKGKLGELSMPVDRDVAITREGDKVVVKPLGDHKRARVMWGTTRALINNMVRGVSQGYQVELEIAGVGYRAQVQGKNMQFQLGFSHDVTVAIPDGVTVTVDKNTQIVAKGADRNRLGQFCAEIRALKPPEPYKGKGIKYKSETILRKEGKKK
jgi:large subunit ribosomal protein L6